MRSPFAVPLRFSTISSAIGTVTWRSPLSVSAPPVISAYATSVRCSAACWRESRSLFSCFDSFKGAQSLLDVGERSSRDSSDSCSIPPVREIAHFG